METLKVNKIEEIITALKNGAVLVLPTDTVYGLVCDAKNEKAVEKIFEIKKREKSKPLAVFVRDLEMAREIAEIDKRAEEFLKNSKTTVIVRVRSDLARLVTGTGKIGMRIPNYEFLNLILNEFGEPLAQTSANISGQPATSKIKEFLEQLGGQGAQPDTIIDVGDLPQRTPSTIIDLTQLKANIIRK